MSVVELITNYWDIWLLIGFFVATAASLNENNASDASDFLIWLVCLFVWPIPLFMKYLDND
jgi:hypothetical protein